MGARFIPNQLAWYCVAGVVLGFLWFLPTVSLADDGSFDGAVWKFKMISKANANRVWFGRFRVSDDVLFQKETKEDPDYSKEVGKNYPKRKRMTQIDFTDLRAFEKGDKDLHVGIKGTARLKMDKPFEWSGIMIDEAGNHWKFECIRVQE